VAFTFIVASGRRSASLDEESTRRAQAASCHVEHSHEHVGRPQYRQHPSETGGLSSVGTPQPAHRRGQDCPALAPSEAAHSSRRACLRTLSGGHASAQGRVTRPEPRGVRLRPLSLVVSALVPRSLEMPGSPVPCLAHQKSECKGECVPEVSRPGWLSRAAVPRGRSPSSLPRLTHEAGERGNRWSTPRRASPIAPCPRRSSSSTVSPEGTTPWPIPRAAVGAASP